MLTRCLYTHFMAGGHQLVHSLFIAFPWNLYQLKWRITLKMLIKIWTMRASSTNLRLAPKSPARKASLLVLMHVYKLYMHMQSQVKPRKRKTIFSKLWLVSQKGCILKLQLSDLKQLWPSQNVMSFLGEVIETKALYSNERVIVYLFQTKCQQLKRCTFQNWIHVMGPHAFTHITPNEMVFETDSRLASKYGTLKITDRLQDWHVERNLWCKKNITEMVWKKKRTEILHVPQNTMW